MIKRTVFAAEKRENTRYAVTGILWEAEKGRARLRLGAMGLAIAGLLMIASGFLNGGDLSLISGGFMLIVFGTGVEVAKVGKPQAPH